MLSSRSSSDGHGRMGLVVHGYREQQGDHDKEDGEIDNTEARWLHLGHNYCHQDGHEDKVAKEKNVNKKNTKNEWASYIERNKIKERVHMLSFESW